MIWEAVRQHQVSRETLERTKAGDEGEALSKCLCIPKTSQIASLVPGIIIAALLQLTETKKSERGFSLRKRLWLGFRAAELEVFQRSANPHELGDSGPCETWAFLPSLCPSRRTTDIKISHAHCDALCTEKGGRGEVVTAPFWCTGPISSLRGPCLRMVCQQLVWEEGHWDFSNHRSTPFYP